MPALSPLVDEEFHVFLAAAGHDVDGVYAPLLTRVRLQSEDL